MNLLLAWGVGEHEDAGRPFLAVAMEPRPDASSLGQLVDAPPPAGDFDFGVRSQRPCFGRGFALEQQCHRSILHIHRLHRAMLLRNGSQELGGASDFLDRGFRVDFRRQGRSYGLVNRRSRMLRGPGEPLADDGVWCAQRPTFQLALNTAAGDIESGARLLVHKWGCIGLAVRYEIQIAACFQDLAFLTEFLDGLPSLSDRSIGGGRARVAVPENDQRSSFFVGILEHRELAQAFEIGNAVSTRAGMVARVNSEDHFIRRQPLVDRAPRRYRVGIQFRWQFRRLVLLEHVISDSLGIVLHHPAPIRHERRPRCELVSLAWPIEGDAGEAGIERAVLVLHHHHAVAPAVEAEIERRLERTGISRVRIVDK